MVEAWFELSGIPVCLIDTAGYWGTENYLESLGIERTKEQVVLADIILFIDPGDPQKTFADLDIDIDEKKVLYIQSKADLITITNTPSSESISVSSQNNKGIDLLLDKISSRLCTDFNIHSSSDPIIVSKRQRHLLLKAKDLSKQALGLATNNIETDILASILHGLNDSLGEVVGNISNKDVVNNIFSEFCVGK